MHESEGSALEALLEPLPHGIRAELLAEVRKLSIHQDDDELFKLLRILGLYGAFYETIPAAIRETHERAITRMEALLAGSSGSTSGATHREVEPLLKELSEAAKAIRNATPPSFEEFRATIESLQANTTQINRYCRELIVELQKNLAPARRGWTAGGSTIFFTAFGSAATGAAAVYAFIRFYH